MQEAPRIPCSDPIDEEDASCACSACFACVYAEQNK